MTLENVSHMNSFISNHSYEIIHMNSFIWTHSYQLTCDRTASHDFMTVENVYQWIMSPTNSFRRHANASDHTWAVSQTWEHVWRIDTCVPQIPNRRNKVSLNSALQLFYLVHWGPNWLQHTATHWTTLQHTATHCNTLHHTAPHCTTLQHTAPYCTILHHTAPHCNTLQHKSIEDPNDFWKLHLIDTSVVQIPNR